MGLIDGMGRAPSLALGLLLLVAIAYPIGIILYRLFFSPLSKMLGPWLTRISSIPEANALKENCRSQWVTNLLLEEYPDAVAVRTGPKSVSFNHPDAIKAIYGHGKGADEFGKSGWYDAFSTTGESLFSTRSKKRHAVKRRMVSHGFSAQSLLSLEPHVDFTLDKFMSKMDEFAKSGKPFDIYFWFELFNMDVMGELALGSSFGALEAGKPAEYSRLVEQSQRFGNMSGMLPFGRESKRILNWVPLPYVQGLWKARVEYLEYARKALQKRFQDDQRQVLPNKKPRRDVMQRVIEARDPETGVQMGFNELRAETSSLMVAGASTGSVTMNWMIYYLCKNPHIKARVVKQLEAIFPNNLPATPSSIPFTKLQHLSLLENVELECLRLHPPIGYAMPRDTPSQGTVICGIYVPGGVAVGVPAATIGRKASVYPQPNIFAPDRWAGEGDAAGDAVTMKACFLGFGFGSRQCIGRGVATQFIMKMIATLLLRYEIQLENSQLVLGTKEFTIRKPDQSYMVILKPR